MNYSSEYLTIRQKYLGVDEFQPPFLVAEIVPDFTSVSAAEIDLFLEKTENAVSFCCEAAGLVYICFINCRDNIQLIISGTKLQDYYRFFVDVRDYVFKTVGIDSFIGMGETVESLKALSISAYSAREALAFRFQYSEKGIFDSSRVYDRSGVNTRKEYLFDEVILAFSSGNIGRMSILLDELAEQVRRQPSTSKSSIRRTMIEVLIRVLNIGAMNGADIDAVLEGRNPYSWVLEQKHTEDIIRWIIEVSSNLLEQSSHIKKANSDNAYVNKAIRYIDDNLSDVELSLQQISDFVGLTAPYFSRLFTDTIGMGPIKFISDQRVLKAKRMLLETDLKIEEIAYQCGFSTVGYFTNVFRTKTGQTPTQYRKKI